MMLHRWLTLGTSLLFCAALGVGCDMDGGGDGDDSTPGSTTTGGGPTTGGSIPAGTSGDFTALPNLNTARWRHTATQLLDGRILVTGGRSTTGAAVQSAELYDPTSNTWSIPAGGTQGLAFARWGHTATLLSSGQVVIVGGTNGSSLVAKVEIFDPASNTFTAGASLPQPRFDHSALLLPNGNVYIAGGDTGTATLNSSYIWVANSGQIRTVNNAMLQGRAQHTATVLPNGQVLLAGGRDWVGTFPQLLTINTCELFTPGGTDGENGTYVTTDALAGTRALHRACRIANGTSQGQVLAIGGYTNNPSAAVFNSIEVYDRNAGTGGLWSNVIATMQGYRYAHTADVMQSGRILVVGGHNLNIPELIDPYGAVGAGGVDQTATVTRTKAGGVNTTMVGVTTSRSWHASVVTSNGLVVLIGGLDGSPTASSATATNTCEFYTP